MICLDLPILNRAKAWRDAARLLASHRIPAELVMWDGRTLFDDDPMPEKLGSYPVSAPKTFLRLANSVICHTDPEAPGLLYQALLRHQSDKGALHNPADPLTRRLGVLVQAVRRDIHKMHAFVRFKELSCEGERRRFVAWFEPDHRIIEAGTYFFAKRFADMDWLIASPFGNARFEDGRLSFSAPEPPPALPQDEAEPLWETYFTNIFNPARVKTAAMLSEMPMKYWKNMPETRAIPAMLRAAEERVAAMHAAMPSTVSPRAEKILSRPSTLRQLAEQAECCTRCDRCHMENYAWGRGAGEAEIMVVTDVPFNDDKPAENASAWFKDALSQLSNLPIYVTFALKHGGPAEPDQMIEDAKECQHWLMQERRLIRPKVTVALGGVAAFALTGQTGLTEWLETDAKDGGLVLICPDIRSVPKGGKAAEFMDRIGRFVRAHCL